MTDGPKTDSKNLRKQADELWAAGDKQGVTWLHGRASKMEAEERKASSAVDSIELLKWAGDRSSVLALLRTLKEQDYDDKAVGYLRNIVEAGARGKRSAEEVIRANGARCSNCGESFAAGTHVARGQGVCEVPV